MLPAVLALGASLGWGIADFLGGLKARALPLLTVAVLSQAVALGLLVALVLVRGVPLPSREAAMLAVAGGLFGSLGLLGLYRGLAVGPMAVVAPIAATSAVIPVLVGLARGERPSAVQGVGMLVALAGVVLASREPDVTKDRRIAAGVEMGLVAVVGLGGALVFLDAAGSRTDPAWAALVLRSAGFTVLLLVVAATKPSFAVGRRDLTALAAIGVTDNAAALAFVYASTASLLSLTAVLASLYPVVTALLARFLLSERISRVQLVGVTAALAGVVLITAG